MAALDRIKRAAAAWVLQAAGRARANRRRFYQGATGLRILTFHRVPAAQVASFRRIVRWCARRFDLAGPEDADRVAEGTFRPGPRDKVLLTFDDGHQEDHAQARWLAEKSARNRRMPRLPSSDSMPIRGSRKAGSSAMARR